MMRRLYFENVPLEDEQKIRCHNALAELAMNDLVRTFAWAAKEAHANAATPITARDFWENLFILNGTGNRPLMDEGAPHSSRNLPVDPYLVPDLQCWLKYLYRGRQRKDIQNNWIADTDAVLQFFRIVYDNANHQFLAGDYGRHLNQMINIRNHRIGHQSPAALQQLDMEALTKHRDTMLELLEPMCKKNWSGQQASQALFDKILDTFYARMGDLCYSIPMILHYIHIPCGENARIEQLLTAAGLQVADGKVTLSMNPTDFADDLLKVLKRNGISDESRAAQLRSRLPGNEAEITSLFIQKDPSNTMVKLSAEALEELIAAGDRDAQYEMALRWFNKKDGRVSENRTEAVKWFEKAAQADHPQAQRILGHLLRGGWYIERDLDAALYWLRMAAEKQEGRAHFLLGECYEFGIGVPKNIEKAFSWYEKGADLKDTKCQLARARCMLQGIGTVQDVDTAIFEYQKLEHKQIPEAIWYLGSHYKPEDPRKALRYFQKAADLEYPKAQYDLALFYEEGEYLEEDPYLAAELLNKAAAGGDPRAQYRLGCCFKNGTNGTIRDDKQAFQWFLKAAKQGHADSCCEVACCYMEGKGVEEDHPEGEKYLYLPAKKGNPKAQYMLGVSYMRSCNPFLAEDAVGYLEKAAGQGYAPAALQLGNHFNSFDHFQEDKLAFWYEKAGDLGDPEGYYRLSKHYEDHSYDCDEEGYYHLTNKTMLQKAFLWLRKAADKEHTVALQKLAGHILSGEYTTLIPPYPTMKAAAQGLLEKALKKDPEHAAYSLAKFWMNEGNRKAAIAYYRVAAKTLGVAQQDLAKLLEADGDYAEALEYYRCAGETGICDVQFRLFKIYLKGDLGARRDTEEAMKWLRKAAERNYLKAFHQMGLCYEKGIGVPVDIPAAIEWYEKLLEYDYEAEYEHYDAVQSRLNALKNN